MQSHEIVANMAALHIFAYLTSIYSIELQEAAFDKAELPQVEKVGKACNRWLKEMERRNEGVVTYDIVEAAQIDVDEELKGQFEDITDKYSELTNKHYTRFRIYQEAAKLAAKRVVTFKQLKQSERLFVNQILVSLTYPSPCEQAIETYQVVTAQLLNNFNKPEKG